MKKQTQLKKWTPTMVQLRSRKNIFASGFLSLAVPVLVGAGISACSSKSVTPGGNDPSPSVPAQLSGWLSSSPSVELKPHHEVKLDNGLRIFFIKDDSLPRVSMQFLVHAGVQQEPAQREGLNAMTASLLEQGTTKQSALQLADAFGALGTELAINPGPDFTWITADTLSISSDRLLELMAEVMMNPAFKPTEIDRVRDNMLSALKKRIDNPQSYATDLYEDFLFGGHPYGREVIGTETSLPLLKKTDLIRHYLTWYRPNNIVMAVTGRFDEAFEKKVQAAFKGWAPRKLKEVELASAPSSDKLQVRLVSKKGLAQTQIRLGNIGIERKDENFLRLRLVSEMLGGNFGSRLVQRVREELGLTYSISASFDARLEKGPFTIATFTKNETAGKTLEETLKVLDEVVAKGVTEAELTSAKAQLIGQFPRALETADRLAFNLLVLDFYGVPQSYLTEFNRNVAKITLPEINAALKSHVNPKAIKILVYADEQAIGSQLNGYNPEVIRMK